MKKKIGPLPVWAWAVVIGGTIGAYLLYRRNSSGATSSTPTGSAVDPSSPLGLTYDQEAADQAAGIDPNTGQTFASESALGATSGDLGGGGSGSSGSSGAGSGTGGADGDPITQAELSDISAQLTGLTDNPSPVQTFAGEVGDVGAGVQAIQSLLAALRPAAAAVTGGKLPKLSNGAIRAPSGPHKPPPKKGYKIRGLGAGNWEYVPTKPARTRAAAGSGAAGNAGTGSGTVRRTTTHTATTRHRPHKPPPKRVVRGRR